MKKIYIAATFIAFMAVSLPGISFSAWDDVEDSEGQADSTVSEQSGTSVKKINRRYKGKSSVANGQAVRQQKKRRGAAAQGQVNRKTRRQATGRKYNANQVPDADGEIDQLPLPPAPDPNSPEGQKVPESNNDEEYSSPKAQKRNNSASAQETVSDGNMEISYVMPNGWEKTPRQVRGAAFAAKKDHAVLVVNELSGTCSAEDVFNAAKKELSKYSRSTDQHSKLKTYSSKDGISGFYFSADIRENKNYYAFVCAGDKMLKAELSNASGDSMFSEAMRSLKMEKGKSGSNAKPKLRQLQDVSAMSRH